MTQQQFEDITQPGNFVAWEKDNLNETAIALMTGKAFFDVAINYMGKADMGDKDSLGVHQMRWYMDSVTEYDEPRLATREEILIYLAEIGMNYDYSVIVKDIDLNHSRATIVKKPFDEFKPFQRVLVRQKEGQKWTCDIFSHFEEGEKHPYHCIGGSYAQCTEYDNSRYLMTDDVLPF